MIVVEFVVSLYLIPLFVKSQAAVEPVEGILSFSLLNFGNKYLIFCFLFEKMHLLNLLIFHWMS